MTKLATILLGLILLTSATQTNFLTEQLKHERVKAANNEKLGVIQLKLQENRLALNDFNLLLIAYKDNDLLEIYAKRKQESSYRKIHSYTICARSGQLGPKRRQGDGQVPEGFYAINRFNPTSSFYLSLGINYPNLSDKRKSAFSDLGGDIFIHGSCVTIGCLPMTDDCIKEIYLLAVYAKNNGQTKIPVYIFPFQMSEENFLAYKAKYSENKNLIAFWNNLKIGYDAFFSTKKELSVTISENGDYAYAL